MNKIIHDIYEFVGTSTLVTFGMTNGQYVQGYVIDASEVIGFAIAEERTGRTKVTRIAPNHVVSCSTYETLGD